MTGPTVIVLSDADARDAARAAIGVARRRALVLIIQPIVLGVVVVAVVLLGLVAAGLARAADAQQSTRSVEISGINCPDPLAGEGNFLTSLWGATARDRTQRFSTPMANEIDEKP